MMAFICHADTHPSDSILEVQLWQAHCDVITPDIAEALILGARRAGWNPSAKGRFVIGPDDAAGLFQGT